MRPFTKNQTKVYSSIVKEVLDVYPDKTRYYHTETHIKNMITNFCKYFKAFKAAYPNWSSELVSEEKAIDISLVAILFHDIVYKVGSTFNEQNSCSFCIKFLQDRHIWDEPEYQAIERLIMYTVPNKPKTYIGSPMQQYIRDLDWLAFTDLDKMIRNEWYIANEAYRDGFTPIQVIEGQSKFLSVIVDGDIYETSIFDKFNSVAYLFISSRLNQLNNGCKWLLGRPFKKELF